jgi:outer membrane assembly lipoprotein YfiO
MFMIAPMKRDSGILIALFCVPLLLASCGSKDTMPLMGENTAESKDQGEALFREAKAREEAGNTKRAIRDYDRVATRHPFAPSAAEARFRQAELLRSNGDIVKAFDAYQLLIDRYSGSGHYSRALSSQAEMAQSAADGDVRSGFLGMRTRLSLERTVQMLEKVRDNAPQSDTAAKAQFTIGQLYESRKKPAEAVAAYRKLVRDQPNSAQAPGALFQIGEILLAQADSGNRNQATLDLASEAYDDYLLQYPGHSKAGAARQKIRDIRNRSLQRTFDTAQFYERSGQTEAAKVYYREIVKDAKSGELHDAARDRLRALGE